MGEGVIGCEDEAQEELKRRDGDGELISLKGDIPSYTRPSLKDHSHHLNDYRVIFTCKCTPSGISGNQGPRTCGNHVGRTCSNQRPRTSGNQRSRTCSNQGPRTSGNQVGRTCSNQRLRTCGNQVGRTCSNQVRRTSGNQGPRTSGNQVRRTCGN